MRFLAILFLVSLFPFGASAQIIPILETPLEITSVPQAPGPNTNVILTAVGPSEENALRYVWRVNGEVVEDGVGEDQITVTTGTIGTRTTVTVTVSSGSEVIGTKEYVLIPAELDLIWEANTYTPPFYTGRSVPTGDSVITISAIPSGVVNGVRLNASNLQYRWFIGDNQSPHASGYGLSSISLTPPLFDSPFTVRVIATTQSGDFTLQGNTTIIPQTPEVVLYQKHPLLGVLFNHVAANTFMLFDEEVTLRLFPLFVTNFSGTSYNWEVNNTVVDTEDTPRELTLRKTGEGVGRADIRAMFDVKDSLYERADQSVLITF